jgi:hypothetical protein
MLPRINTSKNKIFAVVLGDNLLSQIVTCHCSFLVPGNTQEILTEILHHFWLKMMMKSGLEKNILKFHGGLQRC